MSVICNEGCRMTSIPDLPRSGLQNLGNTCYINAVIQCLRHVDEFLDVLSDHEDSNSFAGICARLMSTMNQGEVIVKPVSIVDSIQNDETNDFQTDTPGDSHEVLTYILNKIHADISKRVKIISKKSAENVVREREQNPYQKAAIAAYKQMHEDEYSAMLQIFYGQLSTSVSILSDEMSINKTEKSTTFESFSCLHLPIPQIPLDQEITIYHCLDEFFQPEVLQGENQYYDDASQTYVTADKKQYISKTPNILVLAINRFGSTKNRRHIAIPINLNINKYRRTTLKPKMYRLSGVCHHTGNPNSGHCFASCFDVRTQTWSEYDDETVTESDEERLNTNSAYIILYHRV